MVRLTRGDMGAMTVYASDPVTTAADWEAKGARWLHLVDLDKATGSGSGNGSLVEEVIKRSGVPVEIGGGVRSLEDVRRWVAAGAERICIGTRSLDAEFLKRALDEAGERVVVSLDARGSEVQVDGWKRPSGRSTDELIEQAAELGVRRLMFTDISRDGTLEGPNFEGLEEVLDRAAGRVGVIASGGVTRSEDIANLARLAGRGLEGVVVGRALYSGNLTLADALQAARLVSGSHPEAGQSVQANLLR